MRFLAMSRSSGAGTDKTVYFDTGQVYTSDMKTRVVHYIHDSELTDKLLAFTEDTDKILRITVHSEAVMGLGGPLLFHAYVVVQTTQWWWSFERMGAGTTVLRSKFWSEVAENYRGQCRDRPGKVIEDTGRDTMPDLIRFLYQKDLVASPYYLDGNNCKDFAKAIFDKFAKTKYWDKMRLNLFGIQACR